MTAAALLLAVALLVAPPRHGIKLRSHFPPPPRPVVLVLGVGLAAVIACLAEAGVVAAVAGVGATVAMRGRRRGRQRRRAAEATALQGALDVLVGELRVGAHPVAAFRAAAEEVDGVVAESMRAVAARALMGADVSAGMRAVARRSALAAHWDRLAVCWQMAQWHGLGIATLVQTAQRDIVERERFSAGVDAGMAGARTTAAVLAGLPVLGIGLGQLVGANPIAFLLSGGAGGWLLAIGVALACTGVLWSDRITGRVLR